MRVLLGACLVACLGMVPKAFSSEAIGYYSKGSLRAATSILERNSSVQKLFVDRAKLYTTDEMHELLEGAAEFVQNNFPDSEILQVGDLSGINGGHATRHASHQNGLDADVVYLRHNGYVQPSSAPEWEEYFVSGSRVSSNFNLERNLALFRNLVSSYPVTRIFVDGAIKRDICRYVAKKGMYDSLTKVTLRRLRIADYHKTHFHVRLACPAGDHSCKPQSEPPSGTGCSNLDFLVDKITHEGESC